MDRENVVEGSRFVYPMMIGEIVVAELEGEAEVSLDRADNTISIDRIFLDEAGGERRAEASGSLYAQIVDWIERECRRDMDELRAEMMAGVVDSDREVAMSLRRGE